MSVYIKGMTAKEYNDLCQWAKIGANNCMIGDKPCVEVSDELKIPYEDIARRVAHDLLVYETLIVRIRVDGVEMNQILEFNGDDLSWIWLNDWYEGQRDIEYIGSIRLSEVKVNETVSE